MSPNSEEQSDHQNDTINPTPLNTETSREIGTNSQTNIHHSPTVFNAKIRANNFKIFKIVTRLDTTLVCVIITNFSSSQNGRKSETKSV